ncbi:MAG: aminotransferase class IV family protein [Phycisphaerales bacterium]|nr:aminotransferase class IV family protein [Phycisphaerales bacterium]
MPETIWINGQYLERETAMVSAFDASIQHGIGLFETMTAGASGVFRVDHHVDRLIASAQALGLSRTLRHDALAELVEAVTAHSQLATGELRARVRLTLTGGNLNLLSSRTPGPIDPTIMVHVQPATPYPEELFERGAPAVIADTRVNPLDPTQGHKTVNYWWRLRELQHAAARQASEALLFSITNHVASGTVSNVFAVRDGVLATPIARGEEADGSMPSGVLPGITRGWVMEHAAASDVTVERRMLTIDDLLEADEVFLTNSGWGVLPVIRIEAEQIGSGAPGDMTRACLDGWRKACRG